VILKCLNLQEMILKIDIFDDIVSKIMGDGK